MGLGTHRSGEEATPLPDVAPVDRLLHLLCASSLLLGLLLVWEATHQQSCWALAAPSLVYVFVFCGLLAHRLERKRFAVDFYIDRESPWRKQVRGRWLPTVIAFVGALPLVVVLAVFVALSRSTDWVFLVVATAVAPLLFAGASIWPGRHIRRDGDTGWRAPAVADILSGRLAGWVLLTLLVGAYAYFNYTRIPGPGQDIFPASLQLTVGAFADPVSSECGVVESGLRAAAAFEGISWWLVTHAATAVWMPKGIKVLVWAVFFLNTALAFGGFVRGLEGVVLLARRVACFNRYGEADVG